MTCRSSIKVVDETTLLDRLLEESIFDPVTECLTWTGSVNSSGYPYLALAYSFELGFDDYHVAIHRLAFTAFRGAIPDHLELDHLCRNRRCWQPFHIEPVDHRENVLRGTGPSAINAAKMVCLRNHPLDDDTNVYIAPDGRRQCRACRAEANRRYRERQAA